MTFEEDHGSPDAHRAHRGPKPTPERRTSVPARPGSGRAANQTAAGGRISCMGNRTQQSRPRGAADQGRSSRLSATTVTLAVRRYVVVDSEVSS